MLLKKCDSLTGGNYTCKIMILFTVKPVEMWGCLFFLKKN